MTTADARLIALDTFEYLKVSGDVVAAIEKGLINMGYPANEPFTWIDTDTYQLINHGVNPASVALKCRNCHGNTPQMDLKGEIGYAPKSSRKVLCNQCHGYEESESFNALHEEHVKDKKYDCSWCHQFSRPERSLRTPETTEFKF